MSTDAHATKLRQAFNSAAQSAHPPESLPLSYGQEGLWILEQITPGTPAHNLAEAWQLKGQLDVRSLRRSLEQIVQRQEALRTSFSQHDGKPMQVVHPTASLPGPLMDLSQRSDKHSLLQRWLATEARRPFDLNRAPLVRVGLFRLEPQEHVLFINMHHLISDAWSQGVFMRELAEFYSAAVRSTEPALQELPIQYADYVLWQRQRMEGSVLEEQIAYWQQQL